mmetsp:Transcript_11635/g.49717  ORF Transcript_11635/g.49717 Transcript_11635/m.49717 type:complete len:505 (-) Transcript_11635:976-2490(-)
MAGSGSLSPRACASDAVGFRRENETPFSSNCGTGGTAHFDAERWPAARRPALGGSERRRNGARCAPFKSRAARSETSSLSASDTGGGPALYRPSPRRSNREAIELVFSVPERPSPVVSFSFSFSSASSGVSGFPERTTRFAARAPRRASNSSPNTSSAKTRRCPTRRPRATATSRPTATSLPDRASGSPTTNVEEKGERPFISRFSFRRAANGSASASTSNPETPNPPNPVMRDRYRDARDFLSGVSASRSSPDARPIASPNGSANASSRAEADSRNEESLRGNNASRRRDSLAAYLRSRSRSSLCSRKDSDECVAREATRLAVSRSKRRLSRASRASRSSRSRAASRARRASASRRRFSASRSSRRRAAFSLARASRRRSAASVSAASSSRLRRARASAASSLASARLFPRARLAAFFKSRASAKRSKLSAFVVSDFSAARRVSAPPPATAFASSRLSSAGRHPSIPSKYGCASARRQSRRSAGSRRSASSMKRMAFSPRREP